MNWHVSEIANIKAEGTVFEITLEPINDPFVISDADVQEIADHMYLLNTRHGVPILLRWCHGVFLVFLLLIECLPCLSHIGSSHHQIRFDYIRNEWRLASMRYETHSVRRLVPKTVKSDSSTYKHHCHVMVAQCRPKLSL